MTVNQKIRSHIIVCMVYVTIKLTIFATYETEIFPLTTNGNKIKPKPTKHTSKFNENHFQSPIIIFKLQSSYIYNTIL